MQQDLVSALPHPGARTVILDLMATAERDTYTAADLVRAGAAFGIEATGMRTAIARLKSDHRIRQVARGAYAPGEESEPLQRRLRAWRHAPARRRPWTGGWMLAAISSAERSDRRVLRRTIRALEIGGFAELELGRWIRADNLAGGVPTARLELRALGAAPSLLLIGARDLDAEREARLPSLWQPADAAAGYRALATELDRHAQAVSAEPVAIAAATTLILGREAVRRILHDPLLPDELGGIGALRDLVSAMMRYDEVGREAWRNLLGGHDTLQQE